MLTLGEDGNGVVGGMAQIIASAPLDCHSSLGSQTSTSQEQTK